MFRIRFIFRFTISLFLLTSLLTGYRLLDPILPGIDSWQWPVVALSNPSDITSEPTTPITNNLTPIPTIAPLFRTEATALPTPAPTIALAPAVLISRSAEITTIQPVDLPEILIYDDELNDNWTIEHSAHTQPNLWDTTHWFQQLDPRLEINSGATSIAVSPQADYGTLFFTVRPDSGEEYRRNEIVGISFWLNSGSDMIATADLAVAVIGSNQFSYWTPDDNSIFADSGGSFSETRLYFLEVNRTIPANTWVNVIVWLNTLAYDPPYQYVTGFYIKNDLNFRNTYYIDRVALVMAP
jgi:hypothetical protein